MNKKKKDNAIIMKYVEVNIESIAESPPVSGESAISEPEIKSQNGSPCMQAYINLLERKKRKKNKKDEIIN